MFLEYHLPPWRFMTRIFSYQEELSCCPMRLALVWPSIIQSTEHSERKSVLYTQEITRTTKTSSFTSQRQHTQEPISCRKLTPPREFYKKHINL